ncbi:MAG: hypothetical protein JWO15_3962 [Sphingomonadales bacterium]|nr:hypothetical protein [Sphingomonadales bacterium]
MISYRCKSGSTPAVILSVARLVFGARVAATRMLSKFLMQIGVFCIGCYIGYVAITRKARIQDAGTRLSSLRSDFKRADRRAGNKAQAR